MTEEISRLQREAKAMVDFLKELEKEEDDLVRQNEILAREALLNGYLPTASFVTTNVKAATATKKRKQPATAK
jgi:hypothetical protein